jgi:peptidoglycan/xylan/chitin deacetylase (PgdA/CDA1 family)
MCTALFVYASFSISFGFYLRAFCRKPTNEKLLALTFDDGPHFIYTKEVLDILKKNDVKATFFIVGNQIFFCKDILRRTLVEGHQIGNHSFTHKNNFPWLGVKKMASNLLQCEQAIEQAAGYQTKWFRPPFGVTNYDVAKAVKIRGYRVAGWSIRSLDTVMSDKEKVVRRVISRLRPGAVILLHDCLPNTPYIAEQIIRQAKGKGYTFVTVEEMFDK